MPEPLPETLAACQRCFANHIRDPQQHPCPSDTTSTRMAVYRELFLNNVTGVLEESLPATRAQLTEALWTALVQRFFAEHHCHTPYFYRLPGEFVSWLFQSNYSAPTWLCELAEFEWTQRLLAFSEEFAAALPLDPEGDLLEGIPQLNPTLQWRAYSHAVHQLAVDDGKVEPHPTSLLLWRDCQWQVRLLELNPASARLLELLLAGNHSGNKVLQRVAEELGTPGARGVLEGGHALLCELREKEVVIGTAVAGGFKPCPD